MNSVDMANNLIFRAKNLQEFVVETNTPDNFRFNGVVPFDMTIVEGVISAKVLAIDFDEAVHIFDKWLETCKQLFAIISIHVQTKQTHARRQQ